MKSHAYERFLTIRTFGINKLLCTNTTFALRLPTWDIIGSLMKIWACGRFDHLDPNPSRQGRCIPQNGRICRIRAKQSRRLEFVRVYTVFSHLLTIWKNNCLNDELILFRTKLKWKSEIRMKIIRCVVQKSVVSRVQLVSKIFVDVH